MLLIIKFILFVFMFYNFILMARSLTYVVIHILHDNEQYLIDRFVNNVEIIFYIFLLAEFLGLTYILLTNNIKRIKFLISFWFLYILYFVIGYLIVKEYLDIGLNPKDWLWPKTYWERAILPNICNKDFIFPFKNIVMNDALFVSLIIPAIGQIVCILLFIKLNVNKQYLKNLPRLINIIILFLIFIAVIFVIIYTLHITHPILNVHIKLDIVK